MPIVELSTALVAAGSTIVVPFVNKVLEKTASRVGDNFDASLVALFTKAHAKLAPTGREPQSVEPKILIPLVQGASLETDEALIEKWAALLANSADPAQHAPVQPGFADVLRQLTPLDAALVSNVADVSLGLPTKANRVEAFYEVVSIKPAAVDDAIGVALDNVTRLGLCTIRGPVPSLDLSQMLGGTGGISTGQETPSRQRVAITYLGLAFLAAVTPPML